MHNLTDSITDVPGIIAGHAQHDSALTGCTVIICEKGAIGGVDQRGGAPGTRETDLLSPMHLVERIHAVVLAGGSAFGLDSASGVMRFLEEKSVGFNTGVARVPIIPCAVLFDLALGDPNIRPDAEMGYNACKNASSSPLPQGNFGAGTGATAGKIFGINQATKTGIGAASMAISGGVIISAVIAVNAFGDIIDPQNGSILAGARSAQKGFIRIGGQNYYADTMKVMNSYVGKMILNIATGHNTVIGAVVTNAKLSKEEANKVAQMAHNGLAMTIKPAHTMLDGDTIFAMATGEKNANVSLVGAYAAEVVAKAVINAVMFAEPAGGLPSHNKI